MNFRSFKPFIEFYLILKSNFSIKKIEKGGRLTAKLTWRAGPSGADVASGPKRG